MTCCTIRIALQQRKPNLQSIHSAVFAAVLSCLLHVAFAQDLAPRAYTISPIHSNAVTLTYSYYSGNLQFNGTVPITGAKAKVNVPVFSYTHSMRVLGRTANFSASLPYGVGNFTGQVAGFPARAYRSGLLDSTYRLSINLKGGPAMNVEQFRKWRQRTIIGASLKVVAPTGQYDSTKLLNYGANRWAFKPEIGFSRRWGDWIFDSYGAVWFFTTNPRFFSENNHNGGITAQTEQPVGAFEEHLSYDFKPRMWASLDANFWFGGITSLNGVQNTLTQQRNSRIGGTVAVPISRHQSLKFSYNNGAYIQYGGNYQNISAAWQYSWVGKPD